MRRTSFFAALFIAGFAAAARAGDVPVDQMSFPVPRDKEVRVDFPVGSFRVEASTDSRVSFDLRAHCHGWMGGRCEERARRIHIESDDASGTLRLSVEGYPKMNVGGLSLRGVLRLPREIAVRVEMGVGDLQISDMEGDVEVDLGVGDASIHSSRTAVRSVDVSTGVGDADIRTRGGNVSRHGFISSTASWDEGRGRSSVNLRVGVGDATVRVE